MDWWSQFSRGSSVVVQFVSSILIQLMFYLWYVGLWMLLFPSYWLQYSCLGHFGLVHRALVPSFDYVRAVAHLVGTTYAVRLYPRVIHVSWRSEWMRMGPFGLQICDDQSCLTLLHLLMMTMVLVSHHEGLWLSSVSSSLRWLPCELPYPWSSSLFFLSFSFCPQLFGFAIIFSHLLNCKLGNISKLRYKFG